MHVSSTMLLKGPIWFLDGFSSSVSGKGKLWTGTSAHPGLSWRSPIPLFQLVCFFFFLPDLITGRAEQDVSFVACERRRSP